MTDPAELAKLAARLNRDATCLEAWAKGIGPHPDTVRGGCPQSRLNAFVKQQQCSISLPAP